MIRITVKSWTGVEWEGVLLSQRGLQMRIALRGQEDVAELWYYGGQWFAENGDPVQIGIQGPAAFWSNSSPWLN